MATPPPNLQARAGSGPWPTLCLLDAPITLVIATQVAQTTMAFSLGQMRAVAVVGIAPATDDLDELLAHRTRNLIPTTFAPPHLEGKTPYGTGGADAMLDLISNEIVPYLQARHPRDPAVNHATIWPTAVTRGLVHLYQNSCDNSATGAHGRGGSAPADCDL